MSQTIVIPAFFKEGFTFKKPNSKTTYTVRLLNTTHNNLVVTVDYKSGKEKPIENWNLIQVIEDFKHGIYCLAEIPRDILKEKHLAKQQQLNNH